MPAGSVPTTPMHTSSATRSVAPPIAWRLYRFGLVTGGLAWICIASTLCGCSGPNGWVKNQSGRGYYNRGNYAAARSEFERALMDSPYNATYAYNVGKAMEKEGDISGAEQMYQHALTLDPSHQPAYRGMSELLVAQGRPEEATALLTAWSQTQPYSASSHVELAQMYRKAGDYGAAEQEINTALQIRPRFRQALNERSRLYQVTGRPARGGPFSELALSSRASQQAMQPQGEMMVATPQTSAALNMASTMPQKDPSMVPGAIQASYSHPQMSSLPNGVTPMMSAAPAQMYQANMVPGQFGGDSSGWMPAQEMHTQGMPAQGMPVQFGLPQNMPVQSSYAPQPYAAQQFSQPQVIPTQMPHMQMGQPYPGPGGMSSIPADPYQQPMMQGQPVQNQPVELGQPVPITQAFPVMQTPPMYSPQPGEVPMLTAAPSVQAF